MVKLRLCSQLLAGACAATLFACASDDSADASATAGAMGHDDEEGSAKCEPDYLAFSTGDENGLHQAVEGTSFEVRLIEANHEPPKRDFNTWTIAVRDAASGAPASTAVVSWACAWMNVHQHGSNPKQLESLGDGKFKLVDQNLSMFGPWEIRLWIDPSGKAPLYSPQGGSTQANGMACTPSSGPKGKYNTEFRICVPDSIAN
jgi:hypothetical protein